MSVSPPKISSCPNRCARGVVIVMGVSGSGKSNIGVLLAERLGVPFLEGDDFHSASNVAKMARGDALDDADRAPWLAAIRFWIITRDGRGGVVACSALKRVYRDALSKAVTPAPALVLLAPSRDTLLNRMRTREGHFMPIALLHSQLTTLERPGSDEHALVLDNEGAESAALAAILEWLDRA